MLGDFHTLLRGDSLSGWYCKVFPVCCFEAGGLSGYMSMCGLEDSGELLMVEAV